MPDGFAAATSSAVFQYFKGTVQKREAVSNKFLWLVHKAPGLCVQGEFNAEDPWTHPDSSQQYAFWFWTFNGLPAHPDPTDPDPSLPPAGVDCVRRAVQWYYKTGVSNGPPTVSLWAFNMKTGSFAGESPVQAPPEAAGQNSVPTSDQDWTITAKDFIGSGNQTQPFHHWWKTGSAPQAAYDKDLELAKGVGGSAVAFYGEEPGGGATLPGGGNEFESKPVKDALAEIKQASLDFENLFDLSIYVRRLAERLERLEQQTAHGRAFISAPERPDVGGKKPRGGR